MTKRNWIFLTVLALFLVYTITLLLSDVPDDSDCPAPVNLESMEVYQMLHSAVTPDSSPEEAVQAFLEMCSIPVDCRSDMILIEYHHWNTTGRYNIHLARQFQFSDSAEYVQLHLDLSFAADETMDLPRGSMWYTNDRANLENAILESTGYQAAAELTLDEAKVSIGWTW